MTSPCSPSRQDYAARKNFDSETDSLVLQLLDEGGIEKPSLWRSQRGRFCIFVATLITTLIASVVYQVLRPVEAAWSKNLPNGAELATALVSAAIALFAYYQWIEARRETSLDKFFDRLSLVNERYFEWEEARELVGHSWGSGPFRQGMYVYLEIDNLEYVLTRYRLGFVTTQLLQRALRTFRWRCMSEAFAKLARELVRKGGYQAHTIKVVNALTARSERSGVI